MLTNSAAYHSRLSEFLLTPCLLVYPDIVEENLRAMIRIAGGCKRLRPHVKTHKMPDIVRLEIDAGIKKHKCATLSEARLLAECGAADVLIAYPMVGPNVVRLMQLIVEHPATRFSTIVDHPLSTKRLATAAQENGIELDVFIDIDSGMGRTGIPANDSAFTLAQQIAAASHLRFLGLHVYDGQNHQPDQAEREQSVRELLEPIHRLMNRLSVAGVSIAKLVCGGTPTFGIFSAMVFNIPDSDEQSVELEFSPGTSVLSDFNYGRDYPDLVGIRPAALLLTRVISKPREDRVTLDLGHKAVASDSPAGHRCHFIDYPHAKEISHSEEHLVVEFPEAGTLKPGDALYVLPAHICPTVNLHSLAHVVRGSSQVQSFDTVARLETWPVVARDRIYTR